MGIWIVRLAYSQGANWICHCGNRWFLSFQVLNPATVAMYSVQHLCWCCISQLLDVFCLHWMFPLVSGPNMDMTMLSCLTSSSLQNRSHRVVSTQASSSLPKKSHSGKPSLPNKSLKSGEQATMYSGGIGSQLVDSSNEKLVKAIGSIKVGKAMALQLFSTPTLVLQKWSVESKEIQVLPHDHSISHWVYCWENVTDMIGSHICFALGCWWDLGAWHQWLYYILYMYLKMLSSRGTQCAHWLNLSLGLCCTLVRWGLGVIKRPGSPNRNTIL